VLEEVVGNTKMSRRTRKKIVDNNGVRMTEYQRGQLFQDNCTLLWSAAVPDLSKQATRAEAIEDLIR
jgi:hypothetical protein